MKKHIYLLVIGSLLLAGWNIETKAAEPEFPKYVLSTKPLLLFDGEYKLSLEKALNNPQHWLGAGISFFYLPDKADKVWETRNTIDFDDLESLKGFGLDASYKYYFFRNIMYVGSDINYSHYRTKYSGFYTHRFEEDGLVFYEQKRGKIKEDLDKLAVNAYFGVGTPIARKFFVDTYIGIGYSKNLNKNPMYDSIFGFGYTGFYPVLGARIGMTFGK